MGKLVSIVYKPNEAEAAQGYAREALTEAALVAGHGIEGDAKGGGKSRHLNIMSAETVQSLRSDGFLTQPGQLGEQLVVNGLAVDTLPSGTRLQIGDCACAEVVEARTGCAKFERWQAKARQEAAGRLGVIARVITGGTVRIGDPVIVVGRCKDAACDA